MCCIVYTGTKRDASGQPTNQPEATSTGQAQSMPPATPPVAQQAQPEKQNTMIKPKNIVPLSQSFVKKDTLHVNEPGNEGK